VPTSVHAAKPAVENSSAPKEATTTTAPTAAPAAEEGAPRRRKLVRGGNKQEVKVLPEFQAALDAIADLESFLDEYESADKDLAAETEVRKTEQAKSDCTDRTD
jgi:SpoU rRNA methylase family enzyme